MQNRRNFRREVDDAGTLGGNRQGVMDDHNRNPSGDESESNMRRGEEKERQPERCHSYSVVTPNERKRRELLQQRERNMQHYEEAKAKNRMMYDSGRPQKIGGPPVSKDQLLEKRVMEQRRAEALEKRKVYEQKKKREKWAAEKKELEDKELWEKKQKARAQAERNEEKKKQDEIARRKRYDDERRRRWEDVANHGAMRGPQRVYSPDAGLNQAPNSDELRDFYTRRYDRKLNQNSENSGQRSYDVKVAMRGSSGQVFQCRNANDVNKSLHECTDNLSNSSSEDDTSPLEAGEEDIQKLCQMFPYAKRELIADIYAQTNSSLADTWRVLSTQ